MVEGVMLVRRVCVLLTFEKRMGSAHMGVYVPMWI